MVFLFVFFFWDSSDSNVEAFCIVPEISEIVLISFNVFQNLNLFILIRGWLLYNIVLVLPYINMHPPQVYTCSHPEPPSHLPPHTIPLGHPSAPAPSIQYHASNLDWRFISYMILFMFQCHSPNHPPSPSPTESKRLFYTSVSLLLSPIQGYHYHLSIASYLLLLLWVALVWAEHWRIDAFELWCWRRLLRVPWDPTRPS